LPKANIIKPSADDLLVEKAKKFVADKHKKLINSLHKLFIKASSDTENIVQLIIKKYIDKQ